MKAKPQQNKYRNGPLVRNRRIYQFYVRYPHGAQANNGYRRAVRHFGFHTLSDPTFAGTDAYRFFAHKDRNVLRETAKAIVKNTLDYGEGKFSEDDFFGNEFEAFEKYKVSVFEHDWKQWSCVDGEEFPDPVLGLLIRVDALATKSGHYVHRVTVRR